MNELKHYTFNADILKKEYLNYIDVKQKTIETYNISIRQFITFLKENGIENPTRENVIAFRESLRANHSVSTVNTYLIALRNFFDFLEFKGIYPNITKRVKGLKDTDLHKRESLDIETCKKVLNTATNLREKAIFILTLSCGLRANEIVNIEINDIKFEENQYRLYVLGKGRDSKTDYVIVPNDVLNVLKEYAKEYHDSNYLFYSLSNNNYGGKVDTCTIRRIVNQMYERANIKSKTIVLHSLRHSFATISLENGEDIREVSKALRHKSTNVTEIYLHDLETKNNKCSNVVASAILN